MSDATKAALDKAVTEHILDIAAVTGEVSSWSLTAGVTSYHEGAHGEGKTVVYIDAHSDKHEPLGEVNRHIREELDE